jgi:hypothetical protein
VPALLFVDEVHNGLKDYWMPDDHVLPADPGSALAILQGVTINWGSKAIEPETVDDDVDPPQLAPDPSVETNKLLRHIKAGVWGIVAAAVMLILSRLR